MKWTDQTFSTDDTQERTGYDRWKATGIVAIYILLFLILLPFLLLAVGSVIDALIESDMGSWPQADIVGLLLLISAILLMSMSMMQLILHGQGLPISHLPPEKLVDRGIYQYLRHPIYTGFIFATAGTALVISSIGMLTVSLPMLILGILCYLRFYEEPALLKRYGRFYQEYTNRTPALIPRLIPSKLQRGYHYTRKRFYSQLNKIANRTILFRYKDAIFVTYGLFCALGIVLFMQHAAISLLAQGMNTGEVAVFIGGCGMAGVIGARLYWWLEHIRTLIHDSWWGLKKVGFVSWGVPIGLLGFIIPFAFLSNYSLLLLSDVLFSGMFIGYSLGRIGCLTYGCCYGKICQQPGIIYSNDHAKVNRLKHTHGSARFPTQWYSAVHGLLLFIVLNGMLCFEPRAGVITVFALLYYGMGRFYEEFYRDRARIGSSIFTEGHAGSAAFLLGGFLLAILLQENNGPLLQAWSSHSIRQSLSFLPLLGILGLVMFFILGYHRKELGRW